MIDVGGWIEVWAFWAVVFLEARSWVVTPKAPANPRALLFVRLAPWASGLAECHLTKGLVP